ncbi:MAG TPA: endonuclease/exonuclease/phosphatase family protein, partial [Arenimonas sp.]|nr:endonuclease/exonuclease/phosphatase family protein [Arenimonas sp.]
MTKPDFADAAPPAIDSQTSSTRDIRFATYNTSLYSDDDGGLVRRLENDDASARKIAAVIQHQRPDVLLLNEFDYDANGMAA